MFQNVTKFSKHSNKNDLKHNCNKKIKILRFCNFCELIGFYSRQGLGMEIFCCFYGMGRIRLKRYYNHQC